MVHMHSHMLAMAMPVAPVVVAYVVPVTIMRIVVMVSTVIMDVRFPLTVWFGSDNDATGETPTCIAGLQTRIRSTFT